MLGWRERTGMSRGFLGVGDSGGDVVTHQEREYRRKIRFGREDKFRQSVDSRQSINNE